MTDYRTPYGTIHYGGTCKDDYPNIHLYDQPRSGTPPVKLQGPALHAFKAAELRIQPRWVRRSKHPREHRRFRPIILTGSHRTCAYQRELHAGDSKRYASADGSGHPRAICVDVSTAAGLLRLRKIRRAMVAEGWKQARSDEPWHWSYFLSV